MRQKRLLHILFLLLLLPVGLFAQQDEKPTPKTQRHRDAMIAAEDADTTVVNDTTGLASRPLVVPDSVLVDSVPRFDANKVWIPDPNKAVWLATLFPGAGQIYNRKYWKLPIYYGGFVACTYALTWNSRMYKDYSQAYLDIMDSDPRTNSFMDFLPPGYDASSEAIQNQLKNTFKNKKDYYRKYRDLSIFAFVGVYLLSIIDAYVDAELSNFDISQDLSMGISPAVIDDNVSRKNAYGVQYVLTF